MKTIAVITADFDRTFLGLPSRLNADLAGETVIRRTIQRLLAAREIASIHLLVDPSQQSTARSAVGDLDVQIETHNLGRPGWQKYIASGRKWSLDGWRGGLAGTTVYDEFSVPVLPEAIGRKQQADAIVDVPAAAPLLDPALLDELVRHYAAVREETRLSVVQSAPGLSAIVYSPEVLVSLAQGGIPPGRIMSYRPDDPQKDIILQTCSLAPPAAISHGWGRCMADTDTAMTRLSRILTELPSHDALAVSSWLLANRNMSVPPVPTEIEIEITTADPLPDSTLRPRGSVLDRAGEMDLATFKRIIDSLATLDDRLIVLGGFGDPLLHPQWPEFVAYARQAGILGVALRTTGVGLDADTTQKVLAADIDVLNVLLDAQTAATYRRVHNRDGFDQVVANVNALCRIQLEQQIPRPLVVCELMKTPQTLDEMEAFYDHWVRQAASAAIAGPSRYAGQWTDLSVVNMTPPTRRVCSRLFSRAMILADGRMTLCDQDFRGTHAVGSIRDSELSQLWQNSALVQARTSHLRQDWNSLPLCSVCNEWHRP